MHISLANKMLLLTLPTNVTTSAERRSDKLRLNV